MFKHYYFLATVLPKLEIGLVPEIDFHELGILLQENLSRGDLAKMRRLRNFYDMLNIRALWAGECLDYWGNLDAVQLEEELVTQERNIFPAFLLDYLREYEDRAMRLKHFPELLRSYFDVTIAQSQGFIKWYTKFERDLRLALVGFRARQLKRDVSFELHYEDPEEEIVAQLLAQKDASSYAAPAGFEELKSLLDQLYNAPLELQKALSEYRFNNIEEYLRGDSFSIERILGYIVQYILVDKWLHYDKKKGMEFLKL